jgi:hypothetical protein
MMTMSENLEPLMDRKGRWVGYPDDGASLDPVRQELYRDCRDTILAVEAGERDEKACEARVKELVREVADAQAYLKEHFPPPTQQDLVRESMRTRAHDLGR